MRIAWIFAVACLPLLHADAAPPRARGRLVARATVELPGPIRRFRNEALQLSDGPGGVAPRAHALRDLAAALDALPDASAQVVDTARTLTDIATKLESSDEEADSAAAQVKRALEHTLDTLDVYHDWHPELTLLPHRLERARTTVADLRDDQPLRKQRTRLDAALEDVSSVVVAAAGAPEERPTL